MQAAGPSGRDPKPAYFAQTPDGTRFSAQSFADLNLSRPLVKACTALGYSNPTPIQVPDLTMPLSAISLFTLYGANTWHCVINLFVASGSMRQGSCVDHDWMYRVDDIQAVVS